MIHSILIDFEYSLYLNLSSTPVKYLPFAVWKNKYVITSNICADISDLQK